MQKRVKAFLLVLLLLLSWLSFTQAASYKTLKTGSRGDDVKKMQTALKEKGYYSGKLDGIFGKGTLSAVKAFQKDNGLKTDGIAGPQTLGKLYAKNTETTEKPAGSAKPTATPKPSAKEKIPSKVQSLLKSIVKSSGASCGTLVLSKNGKTFLKYSFGGVSEKTCFRIASITKWVTAIGLMTLYDQGKLDLDKDISKYLGFKVRNPAYPNVPITARMLLSHTSSLSAKATNYHPDWSRIGKNGYNPIFDKKVKPGTKYVYADYNGALFGCLIEAITGESVQDYMDRVVFRPLGLTAAYSPKSLSRSVLTARNINLLSRKTINAGAICRIRLPSIMN